MVEYTTPCTACADLRAALEEIDCSDLPRDVCIVGNIAGLTPEDADAVCTLSDVTVVCGRCSNTGQVLTTEGRILATLIGAALKGTVIL